MADERMPAAAARADAGEPARALPRLTDPTMAVLKVMLEDPGKPRYGREIGREAGFKPGTVQPILARWETAGVIESFDEDPDVAAAARRPRRRYYKFTPGGAEWVRVAIAQAHQGRSTSATALRPGYSGGAA